MSRFFRVAPLALVSTFAVAGLACGGSSDVGGLGGVDAGDGSATGVPAADGSVTGPTDGDSGTPGTPGDGDAGLTDGAVSTGDAALQGDGGSTPPTDGSAPTDAASDAPFSGVACGTSVCHLGTEVCCRQAPTRANPTGQTSCVAPSACDADAGASTVACNTPSDCPGGQVCCASYTPGAGGTLGFIRSVACAAACDHGAGGVVPYLVCDPNTQPPCPNDRETCTQQRSLDQTLRLLVCQ